ncbi:hypothetical protein [Xylanimonas protaetiae]|uniref:Uncharacterized protein n=1 Tax=Xylanimonas protaetiae TaxID=2509457 RepID=A0A4P6F5M8_9MICO|nr:hypothetical protein [Xylanimonas protaetiae]QAY70686.1 hypothetical protein ET471_12210 [Xylanimonas protaetiae]
MPQEPSEALHRVVHVDDAGGAVDDPFGDLDALPLAEHVARFEEVHDSLRARLAGEPVDSLGGRPTDGGVA